MGYVGKKPADIIATAVDTTTGTFSGDLTVDTNTLYVDSANNRVGVGTVSPTELVHANGSAVSALKLTTNSYTNGTVFKVQGDGASYIYNTENAMLRLGTNNLERIRIDASGNVGIGNTGNSSRKLDITQDSGQSAGVRVRSDGSGAYYQMFTGTANPKIGSSHNTDQIELYTGGTERMRIDSSGNVGIGTSSPNGNGILTLNAPTNNSPQIVFTENDTAKWLIGHRHDGDHFRFYDLANSAERMRITNSGVVSINSSSPTSYANSQATLFIEDSINPAIALSDTGQSKDYFIAALGTQLSIRYADGGGSSNATNITELIKMDNSGAVTMPNQPAFQVHKTNVDQNNIAEGTDVTITFNGEQFDQNADFASNTFTAPVTGKYFLDLVVRLESVQAAVHYYALYIKTSNKNYGTIYDTRVFDTDSAYFTMKVSILADMDANDTAYAAILQEASGTTTTDIDGDTSWTYFSGYLVA